MWNREEVRDFSVNGPVGVDGTSTLDRRPGDSKDARTATFGGSVIVKGDVSASEDLTIDGRVEGRIDLPENTLTIGPNATIQANVIAKIVVVFGSLVGTITAREKVDVRRSGSVEGNVACARLAIQEGAHFSGKVDTKGQRKPAVDANPKADKPVALAPVA
jgi:cytoskeletal protein CcmA (bactofilin family)